MAYRVVWARRAFQDLETIVSYIAQDSPAYASAVLKNIVSQTRTLTSFPRSGRKTADEVYRLYGQAHLFLDYVRKRLEAISTRQGTN